MKYTALMILASASACQAGYACCAKLEKGWIWDSINCVPEKVEWRKACVAASLSWGTYGMSHGCDVGGEGTTEAKRFKEACAKLGYDSTKVW
ncbi:hypothetical protein K7432_015904 [Basidiobolus ranarum]|uniref:Uncharacterized protein n=1 Tax=Basidiobolus ranarum TaxID=34480 RepID=A0ABR2VMC9_9FUNG